MTSNILFAKIKSKVPNLVIPIELMSEKNHKRAGNKLPNKPLSKKDVDHKPPVNS